MSTWSSTKFYNRWLREQSKLLDRDRSTLIISTAELLEQASVLATIRRYAKRMNTGKVRIEACHGEIRLSVEGSKEMST